MEKYVLLRLCQLLQDKDELIAKLIGMSEEHYKIKKHPSFLASRPTGKIRPNPVRNFPIIRTARGEQCTLAESGSVFLDRTITDIYGVGVAFSEAWGAKLDRNNDDYRGKGPRPSDLERKGPPNVFQWTIRLDEYGSSYFCLGSCSLEHVAECNEYTVGNVDGSCGFCFLKKADGTLRSELHGTVGGHEVRDEYDEVPAESTVAVEIDTSEATLVFSVDGERFAYAIWNVPLPCRLGVGMGPSYDQWNMPITPGRFTSLSFRRLPAPTTSPVECIFYECGEDDFSDDGGSDDEEGGG